jgi:hypothetical protein
MVVAEVNGNGFTIRFPDEKYVENPAERQSGQTN